MNQFNNDIESNIQKYVRNELSNDEIVQFEDYFVDKPAVLEKIEIAREMLFGLNASNEQVLLETLKQPDGSRGPSNITGLVSRFLGWLSLPTPAYASALACLGTAFLFSIFQTPTPNHPTLIGFSTEQTRNASESVIIDLNNESRYRSIFIKSPKVEYRSYLLSVIDSKSGELAWQSASFSFSALRDRMIFLPDELKLSNAKIELLAEIPNKAPVSVPFCHYSEVCE